jgi:hypothetical protein
MFFAHGVLVKKFTVVALLAILAWLRLSKEQPLVRPEALEEGQSQYSAAPTQIDQAHSTFVCDGREYCSQMNSRAEAEFFIKNCPNTKMDGDRDGEPCENDSRF